MRKQPRGNAPPRTLRMKQWMVVSLFLFLALAALCFHFTDMLLGRGRGSAGDTRPR